jgi:hypothetical protein
VFKHILVIGAEAASTGLNISTKGRDVTVLLATWARGGPALLEPTTSHGAALPCS